MSTSPRPEGASWITTHITVADVDKAAEFYSEAFGFEKSHMVAGEDNTTWHAEMRYQDQMIMFGRAGAYGAKVQPPKAAGKESPINLYLYCEDVDAFYERAIQAGAISQGKPENTFWHDRMCRLQDQDGYTWCFATYLGED